MFDYGGFKYASKEEVIEKSIRFWAGPCSVERPMLPDSPGAGVENFDVSNHR